MRVSEMRKGIIVTVHSADRSRFKAVVANRSNPQKHAWRCRIELLTAERLVTSPACFVNSSLQMGTQINDVAHSFRMTIKEKSKIGTE
jgi:hypothetical protein